MSDIKLFRYSSTRATNLEKAKPLIERTYSEN